MTRPSFDQLARDLLDDHSLAVSEIGNGSTRYGDEALNDVEVVAT
jgi:hypothetical protein